MRPVPTDCNKSIEGSRIEHSVVIATYILTLMSYTQLPMNDGSGCPVSATQNNPPCREITDGGCEPENAELRTVDVLRDRQLFRAVRVVGVGHQVSRDSLGGEPRETKGLAGSRTVRHQEVVQAYFRGPPRPVWAAIGQARATHACAAVREELRKSRLRRRVP